MEKRRNYAVYIYNMIWWIIERNKKLYNLFNLFNLIIFNSLEQFFSIRNNSTVNGKNILEIFLLIISNVRIIK